MEIFDLLISDIKKTSEEKKFRQKTENLQQRSEYKRSSIEGYEFDERAGILQYDGGLSQEEAETAALIELKNKYLNLHIKGVAKHDNLIAN